jgi:predicted peptidase
MVFESPTSLNEVDMSQSPHQFETEITRTVRLNYLLYLPKGYGDDPAKKWPFILFLHGSGERGNDLELVKRYGLTRKLEAGDDPPFVVVSPQCPAESYWMLLAEDLKVLVDDMVARYAIDSRRLYLTGLSMGGAGAWILGATYPDLFAAMIPICGRTVPPLANRLTNLPIWVFHGDADSEVSPNESRRMVNALKELGGDVRLTLYPGVDHDSWTQTYDNPAIYDWLLQHVRP